MSSDKEKLGGVGFFLEEIEKEARSISTGKQTKADMVSRSEVILNIIYTIKGITQ